MNNAAALVAASLALAGLAACTPRMPVDVPTFEASYVATASSVRADLDDWVAEWDETGCTPSRAGSHAVCSFALGDARAIVLTARTMLEGAGVADEYRAPLTAAWRAAQVAAASSDAFSGAGCTGAVSAVCTPLATQAANDTLALHAELMAWNHVASPGRPAAPVVIASAPR